MSVNHTFRYIDDVLSINNNNFHNHVHLIYPEELEIKDTTESDKSASYLDMLLNIDYMTNVMILTLQLSTFLFYVVTYHFHLLMVCMSSSWACYAYEDFSKLGRLLTNKLMLQVYNKSRLK
jgi:hypothetical protein